jgi:hypothetical protein
MQNSTAPKIVTLSLILFSASGFSQVVNIPDANFKALVADTTININRDGEIQVSEAKAFSGLIKVNRVTVYNESSDEIMAIPINTTSREADISHLLECNVPDQG